MPHDSEGRVQQATAGIDSVTLLLSAIVDSSHDAIVSETLDGIVTSWNPAAEKMFGYTAAEAIGQSIRLIVPAELQAEEDNVLDQVRRGQEVDQFETVRPAKDGRRLNIALTVSPIVDARGVVVGASEIAHDIAGRKELEREHEAAQKQLAEALAERDELIAGTVHELRNRLNILTLIWRRFYRMPGRSSPSRRTLVEKSRVQLARLDALADRLTR